MFEKHNFDIELIEMTKLPFVRAVSQMGSLVFYNSTSVDGRFHTMNKTLFIYYILSHLSRGFYTLTEGGLQ